ncbi:endothelin-converting enzyme 1-like [Dermacentor albipictus]|uniref:endothelin-converting enzyme 1-like n=1 Tax=Dermacentor albipictus TaxID=60249 RepID=UPI0038FBE7B3
MSSELVLAGADGKKEQGPARETPVYPISSALVPATSGAETSGDTADQRSAIGHPGGNPSEGSKGCEVIPVAEGASSGSSGSLKSKRLLAKVSGAAVISATAVAAASLTASTVEVANQEDRRHRSRAYAKGSGKFHQIAAGTAAGGSNSSSKGSSHSTASDVKTGVTAISGTVSTTVAAAQAEPAAPTFGLTATVGTTGTSKEGHSTLSASPLVLAKPQENEAAGGQTASAAAGAGIPLSASRTNLVPAGKAVARKMSRSCRLVVPSIRAATPASTLSAQRSTALGKAAQAQHNLAQRRRSFVTRPPTTPSSWPAAMCCTLLVSGALVSFMVFMQRSLTSVDVENGAFCKSRGCIQHRRMLRGQLDRNVDPCEDFSAFVCNRWRPNPQFVNLSRSTLTDMLLAWLSDMRKLISRGMLYLPAGRKAANMFRSCLTQTQPHFKVLRSFMLNQSLRWPDKPVLTSVVGVLVAMALKWQAPLWFAVHLLPNNSHRSRRRLLFSPNPRLAIWGSIYNRAVSYEVYRAYWKEFYDQIASDMSRSLNESIIMESFATHRDILGALFNATKKTKTPAILQASSPVIGGEPLSEQLKRYVKVFPSVSDDDVVMLTDSAFVENVRSVLQRHDELDVLSHLAWLFVLEHAAVADPHLLLVAAYGSRFDSLHWDISKEQGRFCATEVETVYGLLVSAMFAVSRFSVAERDSIAERLHGLVRVAVDKASSTAWFDEDSRRAAALKLESVETVLWPRAELLTDEGLAGAYARFPDWADSFVDLWMQTRRAAWRLLGTAEGDDHFATPGGYVLPHVRYEHVLNSLFVSVAALAKPLYYSKGTKAMFYGGLGYQFTRQLVKAVDASGIKVDANGSIVHSLLSAATSGEFEERVRCRAHIPSRDQNDGTFSDSESGPFPEVPAIEVAHAAWLASREARDLRLSRRWSEAQLFFITACYAMCAHDWHGKFHAGHCNKAVRNFAPFAEAFNCSLGARMNPENKCTFFD